MKVYKLITLGVFKTLLSLKNYNVFKIHNKLHWTRMMTSSLIKTCICCLRKWTKEEGMHTILGWTCLPSGNCNGNTGCHITGNFWALLWGLQNILLFSVICSWFSKVLLPRVCYQNKFPNFKCNMIDLCTTWSTYIVWTSPLTEKITRMGFFFIGHTGFVVEACHLW